MSFHDAEGYEVNAFQYLDSKDAVVIPRGALDMLPAKLKVDDMRSRPGMPKVAYTRELDSGNFTGQAKAVRMMFKHEQGQVIAPPGRGKTEICLAFAAASRTRVLVVVHTQDLFKQWQDRAEVAVPGMSLGKIQGSTCQVEHLTIATAQTLRNYIQRGGKFWRQFGAVIVDEAHHAAADTWEWLLNVCPAHYRFGVTASTRRSDGREKLVRYNIGPYIHRMKFQSGVPMSVVPIQSDFRSKYNGQQYTRIIQELVRDEDRNALIAGLVVEEVKQGNSVLVLSRQIKHLELIQDHIALGFDFDEGWLQHVKLVSGRIPRGQRDKFIHDLREGNIRCILGTQLFEEGVDIPRLNRIVLAFPGTEITALQKVGRGARAAEGKTETIIYDILDDLVRVLAKQYLRRKAWYQSVKIHIEKVRPKDAKPKGKGKGGGRVRGEDRVRRPEGEAGRLRDRVLRVARPRR